MKVVKLSKLELAKMQIQQMGKEIYRLNKEYNTMSRRYSDEAIKNNELNSQIGNMRALLQSVYEGRDGVMEHIENFLK